MKLFLLIKCFVCVIVFANAIPGYQPQAVGQFSGTNANQQAPPSPSFNVNTLPAATTAPQFYTQPAPQAVNPTAQYVGQFTQPQIYGANMFHQSQPQQQSAPQHSTIISKDIYIHSGPEETEEIGSSLSETVPIHKNYRIVFVKAPSHNIKINKQFLKQSQALNEDKTVIYVLSKKPDYSHIQKELASVQTEQKVSKPEVYFIKYKTQDEADRAQQKIQAQYDALGGTTRISDEGVAPIAIANGPNFVHSINSNQQNFLPQFVQRSQRSASTINLEKKNN